MIYVCFNVWLNINIRQNIVQVHDASIETVSMRFRFNNSSGIMEKNDCHGNPLYKFDYVEEL